MTPVAATIGARGFRRWYERQLVESFAHLITGVLSLIMMAIALEMLEFRSTAAGLVALAAIALGGGGLCVFSWRRFHHMLARAEYLAEQATCRQCRTYGRFTVVSSRESPDAPAGCSIDVCCRACGNGMDDRLIAPWPHARPRTIRAKGASVQPIWRRRNCSVRSRASLAAGAS